jgi:Skp family chaperone for outer membrane proteins
MDAFSLTLRRILGGFLVVVTVFLTGCDSPQRTIGSLRQEIADFKAEPNAVKQAKIEENFAKLDRQIQQEAAKNEDAAGALRREYASLQGEYQAARLARTLNDAKNAIQGIGEAFQEGAKSFGEAFKNSGTSE